MSQPAPTQNLSDRLRAPCRACGEAEWLSYHEQYVEDHFAHNSDGSLICTGDKPDEFNVDYIECDICGSMAPAHVWNGAPVTAAMRQALVTYYTGQAYAPARDQ